MERVEEVVAGDGYRLAYRLWSADASDTLVVTLHGVLTHSLWFEGLAKALVARGIDVLGHDRRGSGINRVDPGDVDGPQRLLDDLEAVVEPRRGQYGRIVYLGWCLGSIVALRYLLQRPDRGEGLLLMSPDVYECHVTDEVRRTFSDPKWDSRRLPRLRVPIPLEVYTDGPALETFVRRDELKLKDFTPRFLRAGLRLKEDLEAAFASFRKPSRLLLASRDRIIDNPRTAELYAHIGSSDRGIVTLDSGHGIMFDALEPLADAVAEFCRGIGLRTAA